MKNKFLIFGGAALVIGVGAYLWYKNSMKKISEEFKPSVEPVVDSKQAYADTIKKRMEDKLALALSTNQLALADSHNYTNKEESFKAGDFKIDNKFYGA
jgi:hypothetical protein